MIQLLYIDLFCGAGGTSTGVNEARLNGELCAKVIACVNHDPKAIASHAANHPGALHFTEDIRTLNLTPLIQRIKACRHENPQALIVLWASLECTNFSRAKGGQPRDADSRTLAEHLYPMCCLVIRVNKRSSSATPFIPASRKHGARCCAWLFKKHQLTLI